MSFFQFSGIHSCHFVESRSAGKEGSSFALPFDNRDPHASIAEVSVGANRLAHKSDLKMSVGMDLSSRMLKLAYRRLKRTRRINIHLCRGDAIALPFRDGGFDGILNCYMLDLLDERYLWPIRRVKRLCASFCGM